MRIFSFLLFVLALQAQTSNVSPLTFTQSGTGAVARNIAAKEGDVCSVKDFGVLDDGSDQGVNINKALAACLYVYFPTPANRYATSIPLMLKSGHYLYGGGGSGARGGSYISSTGTGPLFSGSFTPHGYWVSDGGATHTGTGTCTVTFQGGGGGTATVQVTAGAIAPGTLFTAFAGGGVYNPAPTTATLTSGTATCGGTAGNVFIFAPGQGTRDITFISLYLEDNFGTRTAAGATNIVGPTTALTSGSGIYLNGETDAATFDMTDVHILKFGNSFDMASVINSRIGSHTRMDIPLNDCITQSSASTSLTVEGFYCDAPAQDCVHLDGMAGGSWTHNCDSAVRDNVNMGTTIEVTGITFFLEMEATGRYGVMVEGQSHIFTGTCYVTDVVGHRCAFVDNAAQIKFINYQTRNGDYGVYYNGGGSNEAFFTDLGRANCCVSFDSPNNYTAGTTSVIQAYYTSAGTTTGAAGTTCTATFNTGGTATLTLTATNSAGQGTPLTAISASNYSTLPTTATLSSGTATCSGTANVVAQYNVVRDPNGYVRFPDVARYVATTGTGAIYNAMLPWPLQSLVYGQPYYLHIHTTNTVATPTLQINATTVANMVNAGGGAFGIGDLQIGNYIFVYDGVANQFQMQGPMNGAVSTNITQAARTLLTNATAATAKPTFSTTADTLAYQVAEIPSQVFVTADFTTAANTNLQLITGLAWTMPANTALNIPFQCNLIFHQNTGTAAVAFGIQDVTVAPTQINALGTEFTSTTVFTAGNLVALASTTATAIVSATPSAITTNWNAYISGYIEQPSNASSSAINIMVSTATAGDAVVVKRGSTCHIGI